MMVSFEQTRPILTIEPVIQTSFHVLVADKDCFHRHRHVLMRECISHAPLLGTGTVRIRSRILDMSEWAIMRQEVQDGATETISEHLIPNDLVPDSSVMSVNLSNCGQPSSKKISSPSYDQTWENRQFCPWAWLALGIWIIIRGPRPVWPVAGRDGNYGSGPRVWLVKDCRRTVLGRCF